MKQKKAASPAQIQYIIALGNDLLGIDERHMTSKWAQGVAKLLGTSASKLRRVAYDSYAASSLIDKLKMAQRGAELKEKSK